MLTYRNLKQRSTSCLYALVCVVPSWAEEQIIVRADQAGIFAYERVDPASNTLASSVVDQLRLKPGVALSGQGGLFQGITLRGLSGQRLHWQIEQIPIRTERRAGSTLSFLPSAFIRNISLQTPGQSQGFAAQGLGGSISTQLGANQNGSATQITYEDAANVRRLTSTHHNDAFDVGLAYADAAKEDDADGQRLNTGFKQRAGYLKWRTPVSDSMSSELLVLSAADAEIGKSNTDYPLRTTTYPYDRHQLAQLSIANMDTAAFAYVYNNALATSVDQNEIQQTSKLTNKDRGAGIQHVWQSTRTRVQPYVHWHQHQSTERDGISDIDAEEYKLFGGVEFSSDFNQWHLASHLAYLWHRQKNSGTDQSSDFTASLTATWQTRQTRIGVEIARNIRPPTLNERYFTGITGRGNIQANPSLHPEVSHSVNFSWGYRTNTSEFAVELFAAQLEDAIERIEISPGTYTNQNTTRVDLRGVRWLAQKDISTQWRVGGSGQYSNAEDRRGAPTNNQGATEFSVFGAFQTQHHQMKATLNQRLNRDDVSSSDVELDSATILDVIWQFKMSQKWQLTSGLYNVLNKSYQLSTDSKATRSFGRNIKLEIAYVTR